MSDIVLSASTASLAGTPMDEALELASGLGFDAVELTLWGEAFHSVGDLPGTWWRETGQDERRYLRECIDRFGFVDGHLPFVECPLVSANKFVQALGRELIFEALEALATLGGKIGVFHVGPCAARSPDGLWDRLVAACRALGDKAQQLGLRVAVETGYPVGDAFPRLVHEVGHPAVGACIDVGHLVAAVGRERRNTDHGASAYNDYLLGLVGQLGPKLWHFHVHDVRYDDWRDHREAGTGILDFAALVARLRECGFSGRFVFELEEPDTIDALRRSKAHLEHALGQAGDATA